MENVGGLFCGPKGYAASPSKSIGEGCPSLPTPIYIWLVGCFGLNGPLRQYFSLCRSDRLSERGEREKDKRNDR